MSLVNEYINAVKEHISKLQRTDWPVLYIDAHAEMQNISIKDFYVIPTINAMVSSNRDDNSSKNFFMVRGDAGIGKSLFARRMLLGLLERDMDFIQALPEELKDIGNANRLPIYFEFDAERFNDCQDTERFITSIVDSACKNLQSYFANSETIDDIRKMLIDRINDGNVCIFADGLSDLMNKNIRNNCFSKLLYMINNNPNVIFVTCIRDLGIFSGITGFIDIRASLQRIEIDLSYTDEHVEILYDTYAKLYSRIKGENVKKQDVKLKSFMKQLFHEEYRYSPVVIGYMLNAFWNAKDTSIDTKQMEFYVKALVYWNSNKKYSCLSQDTVLGMLAYLAFSSMKNNEFFISWERLKEMVALYISDIGGGLSEKFYNISTDEIAREVANTDIMVENDMAQFLFYDAVFHNDLYEYLIAYAIVHHMVDEDLRDYKAHRIVCDVFDYFENGSSLCHVSKEGIISHIFSFQDREVNHDIARRLLNNRDDIDKYAKILLNCIEDRAFLDDKIRYEVYGFLLTNDKISDWDIRKLKIRGGRGLMTMAKDANILFMEENKYEYGLFCAAMEVMLLSAAGKSPFVDAEKMIMSDSLDAVKKGILMMTVLKLCSGFDIDRYYAPKVLERIRSLLARKQNTDFYETVHTAIKKKGFAYKQIVSDEALTFLEREYDQGNPDVECLLELEPEGDMVYEHEFDIMGTKYQVSFYKDLVKYGEIMGLVNENGEDRLVDRLAIMSRRNWIKSIYINNGLIENYRELLIEKVQKGDALSVINDALCMISYGDNTEYLNDGAEYLKNRFSQGRIRDIDKALSWWFVKEPWVTSDIERHIIAYWLYKCDILKKEDFLELIEADVSFCYELYPELFSEEIQKEMRAVIDEDEY